MCSTYTSIHRRTVPILCTAILRLPSCDTGRLLKSGCFGTLTALHIAARFVMYLEFGNRLQLIFHNVNMALVGRSAN